MDLKVVIKKWRNKKEKALTCGDGRADTKDTAGSAVVTVRSDQNSEMCLKQTSLKQTSKHSY